MTVPGKSEPGDHGILRLVLSDRQPIFLHGLERLLADSDDIEVLACCADGVETLRAVQAMRPQMLITGLQIPRLSGLELLAEIRRRSLPVRVIILADEVTEQDLLDAVRLKVNGVIMKEMPTRLLFSCLRKVQAGGQWLENRSTHEALQTMLRREAGRQEAQRELTPREIMLVCMAAEGLRNKEIAARLNIAEGTVKTHLRNIYKKLNRDTRVALRIYAEERGLV